jgi:hypothetical protein
LTRADADAIADAIVATVKRTVTPIVSRLDATDAELAAVKAELAEVRARLEETAQAAGDGDARGTKHVAH